MTEKFSREVPVDLPADGTKNVLTMPPIDQLPGLTPTYFLHLVIKDASGKQVGANFYWLSTEPETLAYRRPSGTSRRPRPSPTSPPSSSCPG